MPAPPPSGRPRRLAFLGTPALAVPPLQALAAAGFEIALCVTNPDRRRGRRRAPEPSPVKAAAVDLGIPVTHEVAEVVEAGVDLGVVVAFGRLIRPPVLEAVPMVNLHFSLLPRWRGAAPVERAILAGDRETGVDLMAVEEELDTGDVYDRARLAIGPDETADELRARLVAKGTELLVANLVAGLGSPVPQEGEATYAAKLSPDDLRVDWSTPATTIHAQVRVGGAWTTHDGARLKLWRTTLAPGDHPHVVVHPTGTTDLGLLEVQPANRGRMAARDWANGVRWRAGDRLGT